jgi:Chalcone isomerase-like
MSLFRRHLLILPSIAVLAAAGVLITIPSPSWANEPSNKIGGVSFERRAQVAGADLRLNGVGMRAVAWFKAYGAGLYLTAPASAAEQAVTTPGPKRLQLRMMRELPAVEFAKAFRQGMGRNGTPDAQAKLAARVDRFAEVVTALGTLREGDTFNLDFDPARGSLFTMNGKPLGDEVIVGEDFYANLLRAFVGEKPYDEKMKAGLLGR